MFSAFKDPSADLDYTVNWTVWLAGDTISSATVTVPTGLTLGSSSFTDTAVTGWISGGTTGQQYVVEFSITTAAGRTDRRSVTLTVQVM